MIWMMLLAGLAAQDDPAAGARAEAEALIAAAGARGVFENVTDGTTPAVRPAASGLICHFTPGEASNRLYIHEDGSGRVIESVGCATRAQGMDVHVQAARGAPSSSAGDALNDQIGVISAQWPQARRYDGGFPILTPPTQDVPPLHAVFTAEDEGQPVVIFALVQHQGAWSYRFRGQAWTEDLVRAGMLGGMMFMNALAAIEPGGCDDLSCREPDNRLQ